MVAELLARVDIRYMYLNDGSCDGADAVVQSHGGVGVGTRVEHYAVIAEAHLLHLVDHLALDVALEIFHLDIGKCVAQRGEVALERLCSVDARLANAEQVEVRAIEYKYLHRLLLLLSFFRLPRCLCSLAL